MIRAKITGIQDLLTAKTAEENGADFISFVFDADSKEFIDRENVMKVNHALKPYAVDVSEGVNYCGEKDRYKLKAFLRRVDGNCYNR